MQLYRDTSYTIVVYNFLMKILSWNFYNTLLLFFLKNNNYYLVNNVMTNKNRVLIILYNDKRFYNKI